MQSWKKKLLSVAISLDDIADKGIYRLRQRLGTGRPLQGVAYRTYGSSQKIFIKGRVLQDKGIAASAPSDSLFTNLLNMYKRFETDEAPGVTVILDLPGEKQKAITDKEGYFVFNFLPVIPLPPDELYYTFSLKLLHNQFTLLPDFEAEMMAPPADAEYGIISDIDDTIIQTGAASLVAMGKTVLLANAKTRLPFAGVAAFYKSLQLGRNGKRNNPFFYVSSSPWNLYDLLIDFMDHNEIPPGPLLLRDFGLQSKSFMSGDYLEHKFSEIAQILETYPRLNFVLTGDSGEQDPPIYLEVVKRFPGRIIAVYIRDVAPGVKREIAQRIALEMKQEGVEMMLTEHSVKAAAHAAETGLIFEEALPAIVDDKKEDTGQLPGKLEVGTQEIK
jgi:phosphatidate phosphatase APP1